LESEYERVVTTIKMPVAAGLFPQLKIINLRGMRQQTAGSNFLYE
jgi:hypothetical protein